MKVLKTIKLYMNGQFPRTESGRSYPVFFHRSKKEYARLCQASRKDLRNAVQFAKDAQKKWEKRTAYNRGQIIYRMAEMMEGKREELAAALKETQGLTGTQANKEINQSIDQLVHYAGFSDKYEQILGSKNPINGPFHNFTSPTPMGVVGLIFNDDESLEDIIEAVAASIVSGNSVVCLLNKKTEVLLSTLGEIFHTSDLPSGTVNLLSGRMNELSDHYFSHMEIKAVNYKNIDMALLNKGKKLGASHLKRVQNISGLSGLPLVEKNIEYKTFWHPIGQ